LFIVLLSENHEELALGLAGVPLMQKPLSISSSDQQALAAGGRPRVPGQL